MNTKNIEEMISSSDSECRYMALSMIKSGNTGLSDKESKILINKLPVIERIRSIEDIFYELGEDIRIIPFSDPKTSFEKYINACVIIPKIAKVYNEDWISDFSSGNNQRKYYIYGVKSGSGWSVGGVSGWATANAREPSGFYLKSDVIANDIKAKFSQYFIDWFNYTE